ncbi:Uncharacterised protein [Segatella copri]|nr:Uncharacterised protein [Segatella copri]
MLFTKLNTPPHPIEGLRPVLSAQRLRMKVEFSPPIVLPKAWFQVSSALAEMVFWMVTFTVGTLRFGLPSCKSNIWR